MQTELPTGRASSSRNLAALLVLLACGCMSRIVVGGTGGANGSSTGGTGASTNASYEAGFILPEEEATIVADAMAARIPQ